MEIFTNVERLMIISRNVEKVRDVGLGVAQFNSFGGSEDRLDLML